MATKLSVNINKVATLRNTRSLDIPSVTHCATLVLQAGAQGLTIHPRPDQRHIKSGDVADLAALLKGYPQVEFNIEGNPFHDYMRHIRAVKPTQCTLVPDSPDAPTSNAGWSLTGGGAGGAANLQRLRPLVAEMKSLGCRVSLFMDADSHPSAGAGGVADFPAVRDLGAERIELYTEPYAAAFVQGGDALKTALDRYAHAAGRALQLGLALNAGHDLNLPNLPPFLKTVPGIAEVSIGHALIADALEFGLAQTVRKYLLACRF